MPTEAEWKTRSERINKKLEGLNSGWKIIPYSDNLDNSTLTNHAVEEYPTEMVRQTMPCL